MMMNHWGQHRPSRGRRHRGLVDLDTRKRGVGNERSGSKVRGSEGILDNDNDSVTGLCRVPEWATSGLGSSGEIGRSGHGGWAFEDVKMHRGEKKKTNFSETTRATSTAILARTRNYCCSETRMCDPTRGDWTVGDRLWVFFLFFFNAGRTRTTEEN